MKPGAPSGSRDGCEARWRRAVRIEESTRLDRLVVYTSNSRYELTVTDPANGWVRVRGGDYFRRPTPARLLRVPPGCSAAAGREICIGSQLALLHARGSVLTSRVRAIEAVPRRRRARRRYHAESGAAGEPSRRSGR